MEAKHDMASVYDRCLGEAIFSPCADQMCRFLPYRDEVLELACGTGFLTERLVRLSTNRTAIDSSKSMLAVAESKLIPRTQFLAADMVALPFEDRSFELVVCQFGLMFVENPLDALNEAHRVLGRRGQLFYSAWREMALNPWAEICTRVLSGFFPNEEPVWYQKPFSMWDDLRHIDLMKQARFKKPSATYRSISGRVSDVEQFAEGMAGTNRLVIELAEREGVGLEAIREALAVELVRVFGSAPFEIPLSMMIVEGSK